MRVVELGTDPVTLTPCSMADLDEVHAIHADPETWRHSPAGAHTAIEQSRSLIEDSTESWNESGCGYWTLRDGQGHALGVAGCRSVRGKYWNLYYRLSPLVHGRGIASAVARESVALASAMDPSLPIIASLLMHNEASARVARTAGLELVWSGPDSTTREATRQYFSDRALTPEQLAAIGLTGGPEV